MVLARIVFIANLTPCSCSFSVNMKVVIPKNEFVGTMFRNRSIHRKISIHQVVDDIFEGETVSEEEKQLVICMVNEHDSTSEGYLAPRCANHFMSNIFKLTINEAGNDLDYDKVKFFCKVSKFSNPVKDLILWFLDDCMEHDYLTSDRDDKPLCMKNDYRPAYNKDSFGFTETDRLGSVDYRRYMLELKRSV